MMVQLTILANCGCMLLYNPLEPESALNKQLELLEIAFNVAFSVEALLNGACAPTAHRG